MKKRLLSLFLLVCVVFGCFFGCSEKDNEPNVVDYVSQVTLDMDSDSLKEEVTVKSFIDGDTTHFNIRKEAMGKSILKARYVAINTPESTGKIEKWGKKAANFTKEKLSTATSIIVETDGSEWEVDSTGERHLVWVWYKPEGSSQYRNLNLEILQNGLAIGSKSGATRYGEVCTQAIDQAVTLKYHVYSTESDPDYYEGAAVEMDLKELRLNMETYTGMRVAFEGTVSYYSNNGVYVESYDADTDMYYGVYVYYGFFLGSMGQKVLAVGNKVRIVGNVQYYETGQSYQVSDLEYDPFDLDNPNNIQLLDKDTSYPAANVETTIDKFYSQVTVIQEADEDEVAKTYTYADLAMSTSINMKNLYVKSAYTTDNEESSNDGAISLTCESNGKTITVRTAVLYDANGQLVTQDQFVGKTIDVTGVIDAYNGEAQIKVFSVDNIVIH